MRKIALLSLMVFAAACGSSTTEPPPPPGITGTVNGSSFSSADQTALFGTASACPLDLASGVSVGLNLVVVNVSDVAATTCTAATTCAFKANSTTLTILLARADLANTAAPAIATGSYTFLDIYRLLNDPTYVPPVSGTDLKIFAATVADLGAAPTCTPTPALVTGGTLTITSASGGSVNGTVSVTLAGGGTLSGTIAASTCVPSFDACAALNAALTPGSSGLSFCTTTPTCSP